MFLTWLAVNNKCNTWYLQLVMDIRYILPLKEKTEYCAYRVRSATVRFHNSSVESPYRSDSRGKRWLFIRRLHAPWARPIQTKVRARRARKWRIESDAGRFYPAHPSLRLHSRKHLLPASPVLSLQYGGQEGRWDGQNERAHFTRDSLRKSGSSAPLYEKWFVEIDSAEVVGVCPGHWMAMHG